MRLRNFYIPLIISTFILPSVLATSIATTEILRLDREEIDDNRAMSIAHSPCYRSLRALSLSNNPLGDEGVEAIAENLTNLTELNLSNTKLGYRGVVAIAHQLKQVKILNLSYVRLGDESAEEITRNMPQLEEITLVACQMSRLSCKELASKLVNLRSLNVAINSFDTLGGFALAGTSHPHLISLNLGYSALRSYDAPILSTASWASNIRELELCYNPLGNYGICCVANKFINLEFLNLSHCEIGDKAAEKIAQKLHKLRSLNLEGNQIGNEGAIALANASFPELRFLNLLLNLINREGIEQLKRRQLEKEETLRVEWAL